MSTRHHLPTATWQSNEFVFSSVISLVVNGTGQRCALTCLTPVYTLSRLLPIDCSQTVGDMCNACLHSTMSTASLLWRRKAAFVRLAYLSRHRQIVRVDPPISRPQTSCSSVVLSSDSDVEVYRRMTLYPARSPGRLTAVTASHGLWWVLTYHSRSVFTSVDTGAAERKC